MLPARGDEFPASDAIVRPCPLDEGGEAAQRMLQQAKDFVRAQPLVSTAISIAVGVVAVNYSSADKSSAVSALQRPGETSAGWHPTTNPGDALVMRIQETPGDAGSFFAAISSRPMEGGSARLIPQEKHA